MYFPTIKPIAELSTEVIELAISGDIIAARARFDHVRALRARLARSVQNYKLPTEALLKNKVDSTRDIDVEASLPDATAVELSQYRHEVARLDESLSIIREWLASSIEPFQFDDLITSDEGINLFLDCSLPEVWDFSQDILLLWGSEQEALVASLRARGQKIIIHLFDNQSSWASGGSESLTVEPGPDRENGFVSIFWNVDCPPAELILRDLVKDDIPNLQLIHCSSADPPITPEAWQAVFKRLGATFVGLNSLKEWPVIFVEQWLAQLPAMTRFRSATEIIKIFKGRDVLLASPGPSLEDCLSTLYESRQSFIVLATVRSLPALLMQNVVPDFVLHVDVTDFSEWMVEDSRLSDTTLICVDHVHKSVWGAGFGRVFTLPEPHMAGGNLSSALHGDFLIKLAGGSVSVFAAEMAIAFGAASVTLIGQDLSFVPGRYYAKQVSEKLSHDGNKDHFSPALHCQGINGEQLLTKADYLWFINEFEKTAVRNNQKVTLINSTAHGAYLEGWDHIALDQNPVLLAGRTQWSSELDELLRPLSDDEHADRCAGIIDALESEYADACLAEEVCMELAAACKALVDSGSRDVTHIENLEAQLSPVLGKLGSIVHFYTSRHTLALSAAVKSVQSLEENLLISAEYYYNLGPRARKLANLLQATISQIAASSAGSAEVIIDGH